MRRALETSPGTTRRRKRARECTIVRTGIRSVVNTPPRSSYRLRIPIHRPWEHRTPFSRTDSYFLFLLPRGRLPAIVIWRRTPLRISRPDRPRANTNSPVKERRRGGGGGEIRKTSRIDRGRKTPRVWKEWTRWNVFRCTREFERSEEAWKLWLFVCRMQTCRRFEDRFSCSRFYKSKDCKSTSLSLSLFRRVLQRVLTKQTRRIRSPTYTG